MKRDYVAALLTALAKTQVAVLALDLDLRSPDPRQAVLATEYQSETDQLMRGIGEAADRHKIVLAKSVWTDADGDYILDADVYERYGMCSALDPSGRWSNPGTAAFPLTKIAAANISCGFVALPNDMRVVPGRVRLKSGSTLDSFAMAVARAIDPAAAKKAEDGSLGTYMSATTWTDARAIWLAKDIARVTPSATARAVILGGDWSSFAYTRGTTVDLHETPVGMLSGALIHANFAEAILGERTFRATANWLPQFCELAFGILAALVFSLKHTALSKSAALVCLSAALLTAQWVLLQTVGVFFEAFVPVFGLWLHSVIERLIGERHVQPAALRR